MPSDGTTTWVKGLDVNAENYDPQELIVIVRRLIREYNKAMDETDTLRRQLEERNSRRPESDSGESSHSSTWIRAELDWPDGNRSLGHNSTQVVVFNAGTKELDVKDVDDLRDIPAVYSRLPSRRCKTVYVWIGNETTASASLFPQYRVTDKTHNPEDFMYHGEIHLNRLNLSNQLRIFVGNIRWLFILKPGRGGTHSSSDTGGTRH